MAADGTEAPADGLEYEVALGRSLRGDDGDQGEPREVFATFRYEFQPASVDRRRPGLVGADASRGVQLLMASAAGAAGGVPFRGRLADAKDTDCLLLFDGRRFRLERCAFSCAQLRPARPAAPKRRLAAAAEERGVEPPQQQQQPKKKPRGKTGRPRGRPPKS